MIKPLGKNDQNARLTFIERQYYKENVDFPKSADLWYDIPYYGKVNTNLIPVLLNQSYLIRLPNSNVALMDNVYIAFQEFKKQYEFVIGRQRSSNEAIKIQALRGYQSIEDAYQSNIANVYNDFVEKKMPHKKNITTFDKFYCLFMDYFLHDANQTLTYAGILKSNKSNIMHSGLAIDIKHASAFSDDEVKFNWSQKEHFDIFSRAANQNGFLIDKNAPWRLIFNLNSKVSEKLFNTLMQFSVDIAFNSRYIETTRVDASALLVVLARFYNSLKEEKGEEISFASLIDKISINNRIDMLLKVRFKEESIDDKIVNLEIERQKIQDVVSIFGIDQGLQMIEELIVGIKYKKAA